MMFLNLMRATPIEDVSPKMESQENQDTVVIWTDADTESSVDAEIGDTRRTFNSY